MTWATQPSKAPFMRILQQSGVFWPAKVDAVSNAYSYQMLTHVSYVWQVLTKGTYSGDQLDVLHHLQRRIFFCARQIWLTVKHVLCDDSPEGHLPEELEDIDGLDTKDLLSYSFRAVHESRYGYFFTKPSVGAC
jgi:hypothetical protein